MKRSILALLLSLCSLVSVRADLLWYEDFNYANGAIETNSILSPEVTNWVCHSPAPPKYDALVNNHKLEIGTSSSRQDDIHRLLSTTNGAPYTNYTTTPQAYASFTLNFAALPSSNGAYFASFYVSSSALPGRLWALTGNASGSNVFVGPPGTFRLGVSSGTLARPSVIYPVDLATNTDYQVVMELDQSSTRATFLWINPLSSTDCYVNSADPFGSGTPANLDSFAFRQATGFGGVNANIAYCTISNLAIATTFDEAATNVWPTTPVAPHFVYLPKNTTNYVGTSVSLSAVANGQSLCALTYQWYKNGNPISGATSNVYTVNPAGLGDTAQYTVTVTNPNTSQSDTTPPVWLVIQDVPAPPQICGQPTPTNSVYYGQTVTLSVCANGTPPITYSWYYNGTLIDPNVLTNDTLNADGSLTIANVRPGNNTVGTYYCHLVGYYSQFFTNSADAVVIANPPVATTIGAVRGMIDPVYLLPTNTTTYFQVTGIVISKTNMTTTASSEFFIQDDTGGICVFVGGGGGVVPNAGDNVTVTGPVGNYQSLMEFNLSASNPGHSVVTNSTANSLPPGTVLPLTFTNSPAYGGVSNAFWRYQGSLLTFTNVHFPAADGVATFAGNTVYTLADDHGNTMPLYVYTGFSDLVGMVIPQGNLWRVTGPMSFYLSPTATDRSAGYQFEPSKPEDFVTAPPAAVNVRVDSNPSGKPVLTWVAEPFMSYTVLRSATLSQNMGDYVPVASGLTFNSAAGQYIDSSAPAAAFYKVTSP